MTTLKHSESDTTRHAREYWHADGIALLIGACIYLLVAGTVVTLVVLADENVSLPDNWIFEIVKVIIVGAMVSWAFWVIPLMIWLFVNWEDIVEWFKVRLTYPRTGYVAPPSYWDSDEKDGRIEPPIPRSGLQSWLLFMSSFWFWGPAFLLLNIGSPESGMPRKLRIALLCALLAIRALRFTVYPEPEDAELRSPLRRLSRFLSSVFNSFIAWILIFGLLPPLPKTLSHWLNLAGMITVTVFLAWAFTRKDSFWRGAAVCVGATLGTYAISQNGTLRFSVAVLLPGIYAASLGAVRLLRHLRTSPVRSV